MNGKPLLTRKPLLLAAAIVLALVALALARRHSAATGKPGPQAVAVETARADRADVPVVLQGLGTVQALNTVTVRARIDGELTRVAFTEGQLVHRGDLLAQIDPRPSQAAVEQALALVEKDHALLANAQRDLARYEMLAPQNLASEQTLETQRSLVVQLAAQARLDEATLSNARTQLEYTRISAPLDARTGIRLVDQGNIIHAADAAGLVVLTQIEPITVVFTLPEESLGAVTAAFAQGPLQVTAQIRGAAGAPEVGTLTLIDNQVDQSTGTVKFKARFANAERHLWPGQFVMARLRVRVDHDVTVVPTTAVLAGPSGPFAYVVRPDSTVEVRALATEQETDGRTVVRSGLQVGDTVVVSNQYHLQPGARISTEAPRPRAADQVAGPHP